MIALLLIGFIAGACAAPQYDIGAPSFKFQINYPNFQMQLQPYLNENTFDTNKFWNDLSKELWEFDNMLTYFSRRFPTSVSQEGVEGTEYKITISLPEFEEKDIVVKAREGLLMIQANHKYTDALERNYLDVRALPDNVNVTGDWIFEKGVLKITFPLKGAVKAPESPEVTETSTEQIGTTIQPVFGGSREEIETNVNKVSQDADVGLGRGDLDKESALKTNEIPNRSTVEATTYAVDLKDEVEFVPVRY